MRKNSPVTLKLALLTLQSRSKQHLLITVVACGYHIEGLGEAVRDVMRHAAAHGGRAGRAGGHAHHSLRTRKNRFKCSEN